MKNETCADCGQITIAVRQHRELHKEFGVWLCLACGTKRRDLEEVKRSLGLSST